jgi:SNF2 family DNA or RNA helicase
MSSSYSHSLRSYQTDAATWMMEHPRSILADAYGLGKTPTAIAVIAKHLPALVVAPDYLTMQWFDYLCDMLPYHEHHAA